MYKIYRYIKYKSYCVTLFLLSVVTKTLIKRIFFIFLYKFFLQYLTVWLFILCNKYSVKRKKFLLFLVNSIVILLSDQEKGSCVVSLIIRQTIEIVASTSTSFHTFACNLTSIASHSLYLWSYSLCFYCFRRSMKSLCEQPRILS